MNALTGTGTLVRFMLRRDRLRLSVWVLALVGMVAASVPALDDMFTTDAERQSRAALMETPTGIVFGGPGYGLEDYQLGPMLVNELTMTVLIALAVLNVLHVVRHTRAEEENGRAELLRAAPVGPGAQPAAALATAALVDLLIGVSTSVSLIFFGLPTADSLAYGVGLGLAGIVFAAITAVCTQIFEHGRTAAGTAFLVVGVLFMARVVGDIARTGGNALSWLSPFAWVQQARPFDALEWWPLALYPVAAVVLFVLAHVLAGRRDLGAGLIAARPGPSGAGPLLRGILALHLRQQRGMVFAWSAGVFVLTFAFGSLAPEVESMVETNPDLAAFLGDDTEDLVGGFLGTIGLYALMGTGALSALSVLRARSEESAGRAELVLATAVGRVRWLGSALIVAVLATVLTTALGGLGLGLGTAVTLEDGAWIGRMTGATLAGLPAALVFGALVALLFGTAPRLVPLVWVWLGYSVFMTMLGALLGVPEAVMDASAFEILPAPPGEEAEAVPFLLYLAVVLLAGAAGLAGFGRRDLATD
ncbi:ABC transporter permease [Nocardiopsis kunsanensis]|uniref:ABC transporter n=1 Tax=Nocardiopsis kunsanensis TaxID=141693 RepID=A0A918X8C2_9ACTN|nr:hypothetical protein [Nocardiopsis kunsanensis]GHD18001.1 ABC transporter [Nocardiopsis kunsanensis]